VQTSEAKVPLLSQVEKAPSIQAICPAVQGDFGFKLAKRSLYSFASAMLLWSSSGVRLLVAVGMGKVVGIPLRTLVMLEASEVADWTGVGVAVACDVGVTLGNVMVASVVVGFAGS
jgi:hypothetical protein